MSGVVQKGAALRHRHAPQPAQRARNQPIRFLDVLAQGDLVTCAAQSGGDGVVSVTHTTVETRMVSRKYVVEIGGGGGSGENLRSGPGHSAPWPSPEGAPRLDLLRGGRWIREGRLQRDVFAQAVLELPIAPQYLREVRSSCSTAAGRYQYMIDTWKAVRSAADLDSFEPEDQESAPEYLIKTVRHVTVPQDRPMTASEFSNAMTKLSWEWAALPPGQYGQPNKSMSQMRTKYCNLAGC